MGLRNAVRAFRHRASRYSREDPYVTLLSWCWLSVVYCPALRSYKFEATVRHSGAAYNKYHTNAYQGIKHCRVWLGNHLVCLQQTLTAMAGSDIGGDVLSEISALKQYIGHTPPRRVPVLRAVDEEKLMGAEVLKVIEEARQDFDLSAYVLSSEITGTLQREKLTKYYDEARDWWDEETLLEALCCTLALEEDFEHDYTPLSPEALLENPSKDSSSGQINLANFDGSQAGSKKKMEVAASLAAMEVCVLDYVQAPKWEVLKKGKALRYIIIASMCHVMLSMHYWGGLIKRHSTYMDGCAIGQSRIAGSHLSPLLKEFLVASRQYRDRGLELFWSSFLLFKEVGGDPQGVVYQGQNEADCKNWEYTLNNASVVAEVSLYLSCIDLRKLPEWEIPYVANLIAHVLAFPIKLQGQLSAWVMYKMASGSLGTLKGNSVRHQFGYMLAAQHIRNHGYRTATDGCSCHVCKALGHGIATNLDTLETTVVGSTKLGDDDIAPFTPISDDFVKIFDVVLGTETVSEKKNTFEDAAFLQLKHRRSGEADVVCYRDRTRVMAKLLLMPRRPAAMMAATQSAIYDIGDDQEMNTYLNGLREKLSCYCDETAYAQELSSLQAAGSGVMPDAACTNTVKMTQTDFLKPMITLERIYNAYSQ